MQIRSATEHDDSRIAEMANLVLAHHAAFDAFYAQTTTVTTEPPEKLVFVATDAADAVVGYVAGIFHKEPSDRSYPYAVIQSIWVDEGARGQGVATSLVATFEAAVKERGARQVDLFVDIRNESGLALWDASGYQTYQQKRRKML